MRRLLLAALLIAPVLHAKTSDDVARKIDAVFAGYAKPDSPGCAVGVARGGDIVLEKAYGMANLEYDIPLTSSSIFEAGSVSKQFTAASVLLLAQDGKLSLDDPVRKYVPELGDAAAGITIRNLLNHTSGLRDWGTLVGLSGWRRGTRQFSHPLVLDVLARQRELNFAPGTKWSYSNSGYNVAAMIVERVSGKSFPDFTRDRIFTPLGMTHSSWRDNFARVVKGRATAYDPDDNGQFVTDMDVENIYGNCCLLTTVGDLLRWNENFTTAKVGGKELLAQMQTPAVLKNGKKLDYAFGLFVSDEDGKHEVYHSGATAGWRAFLTRRTTDDLSIAVLCNRGDANAGSFVKKVADAFVPPAAVPPVDTVKGSADFVGLYRDTESDAILRVINKDDGLHISLRKGGNGPRLRAISDTSFRYGSNEIRFAKDSLQLITPHKPDATYVRVADAELTPESLGQYTGIYTSDEIRSAYDIFIDHGVLAARITPTIVTKLEPTYADGFMTEGGTLIRFTRNAEGRIDGADVKADFGYTEGLARVERLRFVKSR